MPTPIEPMATLIQAHADAVMNSVMRVEPTDVILAPNEADEILKYVDTLRDRIVGLESGIVRILYTLTKAGHYDSVALMRGALEEHPLPPSE